jgi:hypothetical protein
MSEKVVKAKSFELAVRGVNFYEYIVAEKDILRVNSFAFYNFGSVNAEAVN